MVARKGSKTTGRASAGHTDKELIENVRTAHKLFIQDILLSTIRNRNTEYPVRRCIRSSKEFVNILNQNPQFQELLSLASSEVMNIMKFKTSLKDHFIQS